MEYLQAVLDYIISIADTMAFMYVIKAAFLNDLKLTLKIWVVNAFILGVGSLLQGILGEDIFLFSLLFLAPSITIIATYKKNSWKKIKYILAGVLLLFIPAEVFLLGINLITQDMFQNTNGYNIIMGIFDVAVILTIHKKMQHLRTGVKLNKWDVILIGGINLLSMAIIIGIGTIQREHNLGSKERQIVLLLSILTIIIDLFTIFSIIKSKAASYYKFVQRQNEFYLENQRMYFEEYRKNQQELRKFRHDCKNHFLCMAVLAEEKKYEELSSYLAELTEEFSKKEFTPSIGNGIVDAILQEKSGRMKEKEISFILEGKFHKELAASSVDLCTIFANALDNAIDAVKCITDSSKKRVEINIKSTGHYCVITILNFYEGSVHKKGKYYKTTKKDTENHGLGLENIARTVRNNQGEFSVFTENQTFMIECILPYQET